MKSATFWPAPTAGCPVGRRGRPTVPYALGDRARGSFRQAASAVVGVILQISFTYNYKDREDSRFVIPGSGL